MKRGVASGCSASRSGGVPLPPGPTFTGEKDAEGTSSSDAGLFAIERRGAALARKGGRRPALPGIIVPLEPEGRKGKVWTCFRCCLEFDAHWKLLRHKKTHEETAATSTGEKESAGTGGESTRTEMRGSTKEDGKEEGGVLTDGREEAPEAFQRCDPKSSGSEPLEMSLGGKSGRESDAFSRNTRENKRKPRNHDCPHCQYRAPHFGALRDHINAVHLGEKPHQCPHCDYRATQSSHLRRHMSAVHQGQRPHSCPHCDYRATLLHHLKDHVSAVHSKERSHECPHCNYRTVKSSDLKRHVSSVHLGQRRHRCPHCDFRAAYSSALQRHVLAVHLHQKPHRCDQCDYRATRSSDLKRHVRRIHGPPPKPEEDGGGKDASSSTEIQG